MKIKASTLKTAKQIVASFVPTKSVLQASCGCFGCGYGCSGTVGMD